MAQNPQDGRNLTRVTGDGYICGSCTLAEDFVQHLLAANILGSRGLGCNTVPKMIIFRETRFNRVGRKGLVDESAIAASVTRMDTDTLTHFPTISLCFSLEQTHGSWPMCIVYIGAPMTMFW